MSYATPLYYAAKSLAEDTANDRHQLKQRRRRIRFAVFPAQRARSSR
jgi:hypothetical protein